MRTQLCGRAAAARRLPYLLATTFLFIATIAAAQPNVVSGTVKTADGRPVAGATIRISGATGAARGTTKTTQSDANGNYRIQVPPGDYDVDAFYDLTFNGQTYRELWLDRTNEGCGRQLSQNGIVRHFVLRLSGPARCTMNFDANNQSSYNGGAVLVAPGRLPAAAAVRFTFTPVGRLADGSQGRVVTFDRTGAMLATEGGRLGQTAWLHDIPLGRYRLTAEATMPGGRRQPLVLQNNAGGEPAVAIDITFPPRLMVPYGLRSAAITIVDPADLPMRPNDPAAPQPNTPHPAMFGGLPAGRYDCSYRSEYAGEIPNGRTIVILDANNYQTTDGSGAYSVSGGAVRWTSGPLAQRGVSVTYANEGGRAVLTVRGGPAAADPGGINRCVRR